MDYSVQWTNERMLKMSEKLVEYWYAESEKARERFNALGPVAKKDIRYSEESGRARAALVTTRDKLWQARVMLQEAQYAIDTSQRPGWAFNSDDLLEFYPWLRDNQDRTI